MKALVVFGLFFESVVGGILHNATPIPTAASHFPRVNGPPIPTFTFGPLRKNFPKTIMGPEPTGDAIQIYPTGVQDEIPADGIMVVFGPDMRNKIQKTVDENCVSKPRDQCRNALVPLLRRSDDIQKHAKRVIVTLSVFMASLLVALIAAELVAIGVESAWLGNNQVPKGIKYEYGDLAQFHSIGAPEVIAYEDNPTASPVTATYEILATSTPVSELITIETLTSNNGDRKVGDIVYHIPEAAAQRIKDFLGMMGAQEMSKECQGSQKRANQPCLARRTRQLGRLFDQGPEGLMQLAPMNPPPAAPGPGQALGVPVQNIAVDGVLVVTFLVRTVPRAPTPDPAPAPPDLATVIRSAAIVAIVSHVLQFFGDSIQEIWVPQDQLAKDVKYEDLVCPKDIPCVAQECGAQKKGKDISGAQAVCKTGKNIMCHCEMIHYPHVLELPNGYMDRQYMYLNDYLKASQDAPFNPECSEGEQKLPNADKELSKVIGNACRNNVNLDDDWQLEESLDDFDFKVRWEKKGGACTFNCEAIFPTFTKSESCVSNSGLQRKGEIKTECGTASYEAYRVGSQPNPDPPAPTQCCLSAST